MKLYFTLNFWKDLWIWLNLFNKSFCLCPLICLFLTLQIYFIRFSMNVYTSMFYYRSWWAQVDSNHRPRAYQARALTTWAMSPFSFLRCISSHSRSLTFRSWWRWWESNPWPPACRAGALPAELHPHNWDLLCFSNDRFLNHWQLNNKICYTCYLFVHHLVFFLRDLSRSGSFYRHYSLNTKLSLRLSVISFRFSIERRWSSRTFRYGYLVTT